MAFNTGPDLLRYSTVPVIPAPVETFPDKSPVPGTGRGSGGGASGRPQIPITQRGWTYWFAQRYRNKSKTLEFIGLDAANLISKTDGASLTEEVFDTTKYADGAVVKLTNNTGDTRLLYGVAIRGAPVIQLSGDEGYIHDYFVDHERIEHEGENVLEIASKDVITLAQVNKLADYHKKTNWDKPLYYTITRAGSWYWLSPGEWYTLQVGGSGQEEYLDITVKCVSVDVERSPGELGTTRAGFIEVYQNWAYTEDYVARFQAKGYLARDFQSNVITVIGANEPASGDSYCDGTADQTEINAAITYVSEAIGYGVVKLKGDFTVSAAIEMKSNITLDLVDAQITRNASNDYTIEAIGTDYDNMLENVFIRGGIFINSDGFSEAHIYYTFVDRGAIDGVRILTPAPISIQLTNCNRCEVLNCHTEDNPLQVAFGGSGVGLGDCVDSVVRDCYIKGKYNGISISASATTYMWGNYAYDNHIEDVTNNGIDTDSRGCIIRGNTITGVLRRDQGISYGIFVNAADVTVDNNKILNGFSISLTTLSTNATVKNNVAVDNGNLLDREIDCETTSIPIYADDTGTAIVTGTSFSRSTEQVYEGSYSHKLVKSTTGDNVVWFQDTTGTTDQHGLIEGLTYEVGGHLYLSTGMSINDIRFRVGDSTGGAWSWSSGYPTTYSIGAYTDVFIQRKMSTDMTGSLIGLAFTTNASTGDTIYYDMMRMRPVGMHNEHFQHFSDSGPNTREIGNSWQASTEW